MTNPAVGDPCPTCHTPLVSERAAVPWCGRCEWNLDAYEPDPYESVSRRAVRRGHRVAYRRSAALFARLVEEPDLAPRLTARRGILVVASVLLLALPVGLVALAWWQVSGRTNVITVAEAVVLVAVAFLMRPRVGRRPKDVTTVRRQHAPALFDLVDQVARAVEAPSPHEIAVDAEFNAVAGIVGWRRRRLLVLGLPLWASVPAQQRVAILSHELGHFANGDPRRGLFTQPATTTMGVLAAAFRPSNRRAQPTGSLGGLTERAAEVIQLGLARLFWWAHLGLLRLMFQESQRAEYLADAMAARAAGTGAVVGLCDRLLSLAGGRIDVIRAARDGNGPDAWEKAAERTFQAIPPDRLARLRQLSIRREASLYASHPARGRRVALLEARPFHPSRVVLTDRGAARIDAELSAEYARARRDLVDRAAEGFG